MWETEQRRGWQAKRFARFARQATANDQGDTAACAHFVKQDFRFDFKLRDDFAIFQRFAVIGAQFNHVAHVHA